MSTEAPDRSEEWRPQLLGNEPDVFVHEAGHILMAISLRWRTCAVCLDQSLDALAWTTNEPETAHFRDRKNSKALRERIAYCVAGRAAERIIYGDERPPLAGTDLREARLAALACVGADAPHSAIDALIAEGFEVATAALSARRQLLESLAFVLSRLKNDLDVIRTLSHQSARRPTDGALDATTVNHTTPLHVEPLIRAASPTPEPES